MVFVGYLEWYTSIK